MVIKIQQLETEFDQVLILEHLDEGLVLLSHSLCWPLEKVQHAALNARKKGSTQKLTEENKKILNSMLWGDNMVYQYFLQKHKDNVKAFGQTRLEDNVKELQDLNNKLNEKCSGKKNDSWCEPFFRDEVLFTQKLFKLNKHIAKQKSKSKSNQTLSIIS